MRRVPVTALRQGGSSLLLGLLLLALLSLLVTNAVSENHWNWRIASHEVAEARAESAARDALAWAEDWLMSLPGDARPEPCSGECAGVPVLAPGAVPASPETHGERWWLTNAHARGADPLTGGQLPTAGDPRTPPGRWLVEEAHFAPAGSLGAGVPDVGFYRIVARAARAPSGAPVVIEAVVARPWGDRAWSDPLPASGAAFCRGAGLPGPCGRMSWRRRR